MNTLEKVTAFITRQEEEAKELLVFQHPSAGVQVPAGTVEAGEPIEQAVLRETFEETGLEGVRIICKLDTQLLDPSGNERALLEETELFTEPSVDSPHFDFRPGRGWWVKVTGGSSEWSQVVYEEYDLNTSPPILLTRYSGWVPSRLLASRVVRHFFHLTPIGPTPDTWEQEADRHLFRLYWVPLAPKPKLIEGQDAWLDRVYDALFCSTGTGCQSTSASK